MKAITKYPDQKIGIELECYINYSTVLEDDEDVIISGEQMARGYAIDVEEDHSLSFRGIEFKFKDGMYLMEALPTIERLHEIAKECLHGENCDVVDWEHNEYSGPFLASGVHVHLNLPPDVTMCDHIEALKLGRLNHGKLCIYGLRDEPEWAADPGMAIDTFIRNVESALCRFRSLNIRLSDDRDKAVNITTNYNTTEYRHPHSYIMTDLGAFDKYLCEIIRLHQSAYIGRQEVTLGKYLFKQDGKRNLSVHTTRGKFLKKIAVSVN